MADFRFRCQLPVPVALKEEYGKAKEKLVVFGIHVH